MKYIILFILLFTLTSCNMNHDIINDKKEREVLIQFQDGNLYRGWVSYDGKQVRVETEPIKNIKIK